MTAVGCMPVTKWHWGSQIPHIVQVSAASRRASVTGIRPSARPR